VFEEPLTPFQSSMSRGEVSPDLYGRVDLQAFASALRTSRNGFIKTEGVWANRPGTQYVGNAISVNEDGSRLIPFVFSVTQSYVIEIGAGIAQVFSDGALVPTIITTPYLASEIDQIRYTQSADTLTLVHPNHPPYELKRLTATTFSFLPGVYNNGPFIPQNTDGVTLVWASARSGPVTLSATAPIFLPGHVGGLFYLQQQDVSPIVPWSSLTKLTTGGANPVGMLTSSNLKNYICAASLVTGTDNCATGYIAPGHTYGTVWDANGQANATLGFDSVGVGWEFTDFGYGVVRITGFTDAHHVTGIVQAVIAGQPALLPATVVGGPPTLAGPWTGAGDGTTKAFAIISGAAAITGRSLNDPNAYFVTINGIYVQPPNYIITGIPSATGGITFVAAPAAGAAISVIESGGLYSSSFWAFGAFSPLQGYPSTVTYVPDRLVFAGTPGQPVGVFGSQTSFYNNFAVSKPGVNSDAFTIFLNSRQLNTICDLVPLQDLIIGTANVIWRLWAGPTGAALGPLSIDATPQAFVGETASAAAALYGDSMIYAIYGGRRIRDLIYQFQFDKYVGSELTAYSRHLIPFGNYVARLQYAPDPWGQLFVQTEPNNALLSCTYVRDQGMIAWSRWDTQGSFDDAIVVPENNSYALYVIVNRTINGNPVRYVERLSQWEWPTIYDYKFMDCSLTYDGRNTSANTMTLTGGTTWLAGDTGVLNCSGTSGWANFQSTDPGLLNQIQLFYGPESNNYCRVLITAVNSATSAAVRFIDPIPTLVQGQRILTWVFARTQFGGAQQLAGQLVACLIDSTAYSGSNGAPILTVSANGTVTLPNAGGVVTVGLQYDSDFETLALNQPGIQTIRERAKGMPGIYLDVHYARGLLTGTDFTHMYPIKEREFEPYLNPTDLQEGIIQNRIDTEFTSECHLCVRQPWPLPVTIRMVIPSVNVGEPVG
jgi:hypothetical protein